MVAGGLGVITRWRDGVIGDSLAGAGRVLPVLTLEGEAAAGVRVLLLARRSDSKPSEGELP